MNLREIIDSWRFTPRMTDHIPRAIPAGPSSFQVLETKQLIPKDLLVYARKIEPSEMKDAIRYGIKQARKTNSSNQGITTDAMISRFISLGGFVPTPLRASLSATVPAGGGLLR